MQISTGDYYGLPTRVLAGRHLRLEFLAEAGPRLVRLSLAGSEANLLAEAPDFHVPTSLGDFAFRGGHRLWHAPEAMPRTYVADDAGLLVEPLADGVRLSAADEAHARIHKAIEIHLHPDRPSLTLHHRLTNIGLWAVELAAWAITQMRLGGVAVLPQPAGAVDAAGLLPNRRLALWPYTRWDDPRLRLGDDYIVVNAQPGLPFKIGYWNRHGWLGYWLNGVFFTKAFARPGAEAYPDFGCNAETYGNDKVFELESLGPLTRLEPGQRVEHTETWRLLPGVPAFGTPAEAAAVLNGLELA